MEVLSQRLTRAINLATVLHYGQYRKASGIPYSSHLFSVMHLLNHYDASEELLIAGLLHDAIEDQPDRYSFVEMTSDFGPKVTSLVQAVTKNNDLASWQEKADDYLLRIKQAPAEAVLLCLADKYHNLLSTVMDYEQLGDEVWQRFKGGKERQMWWHHCILEIAYDRLPDHDLTVQYQELIRKLPTS